MQERELLKAIQKKKMDFISDRDATAAFRKEQKWLKLLYPTSIEIERKSISVSMIIWRARLRRKSRTYCCGVMPQCFFIRRHSCAWLRLLSRKKAGTPSAALRMVHISPMASCSQGGSSLFSL